MERWTTRFLKTTRGKVVELLRRDSATVSDLASDLELTDNAVRSHLTSLERDGLIVQSGKRSGVRKPETLYSLSDEAEELFPKAYHLLVNTLVDVLDESHSSDEIRQILTKVGSRLVSARASQMATEDLDTRVREAMNMLAEIGGLAELKKTPNGYQICGFSCPLASAVKHDPKICLIAETMVAVITGENVVEKCDRSGKPKCNFEIITA